MFAHLSADIFKRQPHEPDGKVAMFAVNWIYKPGAKCYLTKNSPDKKPYTSDIHDKDCKVWKTKAAAERFLSTKSPGWANSCVIEEVPHSIA